MSFTTIEHVTVRNRCTQSAASNVQSSKLQAPLMSCLTVRTLKDLVGRSCPIRRSYILVRVASKPQFRPSIKLTVYGRLFWPPANNPLHNSGGLTLTNWNWPNLYAIFWITSERFGFVDFDKLSIDSWVIYLCDAVIKRLACIFFILFLLLLNTLW